MFTPEQAEPGMPINEIDTPALVVAMEAFDQNLRVMSGIAASHAVALRPHSKSHKCLEIARRQMTHGASGICVQKVSEAEVFAQGGIEDILITNEIVSRLKIERMLRLTELTRLSVCADNLENIKLLEKSAAGAGIPLEVLVEIDVGSWRCGIEPGKPAVELALAIAESSHLLFRGIQAYNGSAQHIRDYSQRRTTALKSIGKAQRTWEDLASAGLDCELVTGAGSGTFEHEAASGVYNEIQPGSYIFVDMDYGRNLDQNGNFVSGFRNSLFVHSMVMSVPASDRAILDCGLKAVSTDKGLPGVWNEPEVEFVNISDEHGFLDISETNTSPGLGDRFILVPGHCDPTVNLYDRIICERDGMVESIWPIEARGAIY
jgi:3-hydroxy-D-aspartate aldolase